MKKIMLIMLFIVVFFGLVHSANITVTNPSSGANITKGQTVVITWNAVGTVNGFKITLWKDGLMSTIIEPNFAPGNGNRTYSWIAPTICGSGYQIKVKEKSNAVAGLSGSFSITGCFARVIPRFELKPHSIKVVTPNGGNTLALNSRIRILWTPKNLTKNVTISLMKNGALFGIIAENLAPGRISHEWNIGSTLIKTALPGSGFKIKIKENGFNVSDQSDRPFSIERTKHVDLSCYVSGRKAIFRNRKIVLTVKVRVNNINPETLRNVPVRVTVKNKGTSTSVSQTKHISKITYKGHGYEYTLNFTFHLHKVSLFAPRLKLDRETTVVVDPDDLFRDKRRQNNTSTYNFRF